MPSEQQCSSRWMCIGQVPSDRWLLSVVFHALVHWTWTIYIELLQQMNAHQTLSLSLFCACSMQCIRLSHQMKAHDLNNMVTDSSSLQNRAVVLWRLRTSLFRLTKKKNYRKLLKDSRAPVSPHLSTIPSYHLALAFSVMIKTNCSCDTLAQNDTQ